MEDLHEIAIHHRHVGFDDVAADENLAFVVTEDFQGVGHASDLVDHLHDDSFRIDESRHAEAVEHHLSLGGGEFWIAYSGDALGNAIACGEAAGENVDLVFGGDRQDHFRVANTRSLQSRGTATAAGHHEDVQLLGDLENALPLLLDDSHIVTLLLKLDGELVAHGPGSDDDDLHHDLLGRES